jgi:hypothetical protein
LRRSSGKIYLGDHLVNAGRYRRLDDIGDSLVALPLALGDPL